MWTLLLWTEITSWAGQRAGDSGRAPSGGAGIQRLAVEPRGTGITLVLPWQILEPAWKRHSDSEDIVRNVSFVY